MLVNLLQKSEFFVTYLKNKIQKLKTFVFYISVEFFKVYFDKVRHFKKSNTYEFDFRKAF